MSVSFFIGKNDFIGSSHSQIIQGHGMKNWEVSSLRPPGNLIEIEAIKRGEIKPRIYLELKIACHLSIIHICLQSWHKGKKHDIDSRVTLEKGE